VDQCLLAGLKHVAFAELSPSVSSPFLYLKNVPAIVFKF